MEQFWIIASYISVVFAAFVTTALVITYGFFTQWDKSQVGRQFMLTKTSLALVLDYWVLAVFVISPRNGYTPGMPIRTIICVIVGAVMLRWLVILVRAQREARRSSNEDLRP